MDTYPRPDRSAPWAPGRSSGAPQRVRTPQEIVDVPPEERTAEERYRYGTHGPWPGKPLPTVAVDVTDRWPATFERVLYAVAATVSILTNLIVLWALYETYLFVGRLGEALRQLGDGLQGIGGA